MSSYSGLKESKQVDRETGNRTCLPVSVDTTLMRMRMADMQVWMAVDTPFVV